MADVFGHFTAQRLQDSPGQAFIVCNRRPIDRAFVRSIFSSDHADCADAARRRHGPDALGLCPASRHLYRHARAGRGAHDGRHRKPSANSKRSAEHRSVMVWKNPQHAAMVTKDFIKPKAVIPMPEHALNANQAPTSP